MRGRRRRRRRRGRRRKALFVGRGAPAADERSLNKITLLKQNPERDLLSSNAREPEKGD